MLGHWQEEVSEDLVLCEAGENGGVGVRPSEGLQVCGGNRRGEVKGWTSRVLKNVLKNTLDVY